MKHKGREQKGNFQQVKKVLIVKQILLMSIIGNVWRTAWRIRMLISGFKGLRKLLDIFLLMSQEQLVYKKIKLFSVNLISAWTHKSKIPLNLRTGKSCQKA